MAGSGDALFTGRWKYLTPSVLAATASASTSAPASLAWRRLMIVLYPSFFTSATPAGVVAPAQAMVDSSLAKLVTPATVGLVIWADALPATSMAATNAAPRK